MTTVFQYGSNMSMKRINSEDRLSGDATLIGKARTNTNYELAFTVWSESNNCAAADIIPGSGRSIHGVLYSIPNKLIDRESARQLGRKSLDQIEGEGKNYVRTTIEVIAEDQTEISAITYVVKNRTFGLTTSLEYANHILAGLKEHNMPNEYYRYVASRIVQNNRMLRNCLDQHN